MSAPDLTVLYYTANRIAAPFQTAVMANLRTSVGPSTPVIGVVQNANYHDADRIQTTLRPDALFWVNDAPPSIAQVYRNILMAAEAATTPYVAMAEDDTLYVPEHFTLHRPASDTFAYNSQRLVISRRLSADGTRREAFYYYRPRTQMAMGLCRRELLIDTLRERFAKHPNPPLDTTVAKKAGWGEPGRYEKNLGLPPRTLERFPWTARPNVTFNHSESLMGRRRVNPDDAIFTTTEPWGHADALWSTFHG